MRADSGWSGLLGAKPRISIGRLYQPRVAAQGLGPRLRTIDGMGEGAGEMPQPRTRDSESEEGAEGNGDECVRSTGVCPVGAVRCGTVRSLGFEPKQMAKQAMPFCWFPFGCSAPWKPSLGNGRLGGRNVNEGARKDGRDRRLAIGLGQVEVSS